MQLSSWCQPKQLFAASFWHGCGKMVPAHTAAAELAARRPARAGSSLLFSRLLSVPPRPVNSQHIRRRAWHIFYRNRSAAYQRMVCRFRGRYPSLWRLSVLLGRGIITPMPRNLPSRSLPLNGNV